MVYLESDNIGALCSKVKYGRAQINIVNSFMGNHSASEASTNASENGYEEASSERGSDAAWSIGSLQESRLSGENLNSMNEDSTGSLGGEAIE